MARSTRRAFTVPVIEEDLRETQELGVIRGREATSKLFSYFGSTSFFTYFITPRSLPQFLNQMSGLVLLPLIALSQLINLGLKWQDYERERKVQGDSNAFWGLVVEGIVAVGTIVAVGAALATTTAFLVVSPAIMVGVLGLKSLFEFGAAISDYLEARKLSQIAGSEYTERRAVELYDRAKKHLGEGLANALITASVGLMAFAGLAAFAYIGMAASVLGATVVAAYKGSDEKLGLVTQKAANATTYTDPDASLDSTARAARGLKITHGMVSPQTVVSDTYYSDLERGVVSATTKPPVPLRRSGAEATIQPLPEDSRVDHSASDVVYTPARFGSRM